MLRGGWREHVRAQLQKRERGVWALRALLERHEKLQERLEAQQAFLEATLKARAGGGYCGPPWEQLRREAEEVRELRREREELRQQVALLTEIVRETEVKNQEQQARYRQKILRLREKLQKANEAAPC